MNIRMQATGIILTEREFRQMFPTVSLPEIITDEAISIFGAETVEVSPYPTLTPFQQTEEKTEQDPETGKWKQTWEIIEITDPVKVATIKEELYQQAKSQLIGEVENFLNSEARKKQYYDIRSAALRAAYSGPYQEEGIKFAQWMDACWFKTFELLAKIKDETISKPTNEEFLKMLPMLDLSE